MALRHSCRRDAFLVSEQLEQAFEQFVKINRVCKFEVFELYQAGKPDTPTWTLNPQQAKVLRNLYADLCPRHFDKAITNQTPKSGTPSGPSTLNRPRCFVTNTLIWVPGTSTQRSQTTTLAVCWTGWARCAVASFGCCACVHAMCAMDVCACFVCSAGCAF